MSFTRQSQAVALVEERCYQEPVVQGMSAAPGQGGTSSCMPVVSFSLDALGDDLLCHIFRGLGLEDLCHLARASRRFYGLVNGPCGEAAWQRLFEATFGGPLPAAAAPKQQQQVQQVQLQEQAEYSPPPHKNQWDESGEAAAGLPSEGWQQGQEGTAVSLAGGLSGLPPPQHPGAGGQRAQQRQPGGNGSSTSAFGWKERFRERFTEARRLVALKRRAKVMKLESRVQVLSQEVHRAQHALREEMGRLEVARRELASIQAQRRAQSVRAISDRYWLPEAVQRAQGVVTSQAEVNLESLERDAAQRVAVCELEVRKLRNQARQRAARLEAERRKLAALAP